MPPGTRLAACAGMAKTFRDKILQHLKKGPATARDIIEKFDASASNVSRHFTNLEAQGLIEKAGRSAEQNHAQLWTLKNVEAASRGVERLQQAAAKRGLIASPLAEPTPARFNGRVRETLQQLAMLDAELAALRERQLRILEALAEAVRAEM